MRTPPTFHAIHLDAARQGTGSMPGGGISTSAQVGLTPLQVGIRLQDVLPGASFRYCVVAMPRW